MVWAAIIAGGLGCYLLKLGGLSVPARVLRDARVRRIAALMPVALLTALAVIQAFSDGRRLVADERVAGMAAAVVAILLRAPFLLVVAVAAATTAGLRLLR